MEPFVGLDCFRRSFHNMTVNCIINHDKTRYCEITVLSWFFKTKLIYTSMVLLSHDVVPYILLKFTILHCFAYNNMFKTFWKYICKWPNLSVMLQIYILQAIFKFHWNCSTTISGSELWNGHEWEKPIEHYLYDMRFFWVTFDVTLNCGFDRPLQC